MERLEFFAQEIKQKQVKKELDEADVRMKMTIVADSDLWRRTYESVAAKAWRDFDIANISA